MMYLIAVFILAVVGVFGLFAAAQQYLEWIQKGCRFYSWWSFPAWMAGIFCVFVPALVALVIGIIYLVLRGVE